MVQYSGSVGAPSLNRERNVMRLGDVLIRKKLRKTFLNIFLKYIPVVRNTSRKPVSRIY